MSCPRRASSPSSSSSSSSTFNFAFPHLAANAVPQLIDVAKLLKDGKAKNVMIMAGAGISTGAGIPDFRSPGTGLYDNLAKYDLPYPEAIFDIDYLEERPEAFYTLAKELYPGNFNPTTTHYFFKLLQDKGLLKGVWTQNIDTLERIAGITEDYIVEAHGSFASAACLRCRKDYTKEEIKPSIMRGEVVRCQEKRCRGKKEALIKPKIVFFGEGLPDKFFDRLPDFKSCDLLIVLGTSLTVGPFNTLLHRVARDCPRVLINLEKVGEVGRRRTDREEEDEEWEDEEDEEDELGFEFGEVEDTSKEASKKTTSRRRRQGGIRDVAYLGHSDEGIKELCRLIGWEDELKEVERNGLNELKRRGEGGQDNSQEEVASAQEKRKEVIEHVGEAAEADTKGDEVEELSKGVDRVNLGNTEDKSKPQL